MSEDCSHGHNSTSEESYFYKETLRLIENLRMRLASPTSAVNDQQRAAPRISPIAA
ncbi:MAG: hypothetical protein ABW043_18875 [Devosia sp.]|uniref:hypothetical protein n=1 Tax=Devosia sp. TaxID=1871048 RepID=UPI0033907BFE